MEHWRHAAGGDVFQPAPEKPDAAFYKRQAAMAALRQAEARRN